MTASSADLKGILNADGRNRRVMPPPGSKGSAATIAWLRERFRRYYRDAKIELPPRFARREYGFMFWEPGMMQRHQSFKSGEGLREFLVSRTPMHAYYSSAYYETPGAPTMEEKGWLGADLIFDLDADHIERVKGMPYEEMLEVVKSEVVKIVDQYLLGDFGFDPSSILITFSGGRGYHIHVRDPRVWELHGHERREIVDYITGTGLDAESLFHRVPIELKRWKDKATVKYRHQLPTPDEPGWPGRLAHGILAATEEVGKMERSDAVAHLVTVGGLTPKIAGEMYDALFQGRAGSRGVDRLRRGDIDFFPSEKYLEPFRKVFVPQAVDLGKRETDEPVTSDIKRLIRMPHTLHGKTGLFVVPMGRDAIDRFVPLRDAVPPAWSADSLKMELRGKISLAMRDETFNLEEGVNEVPEYVAVFLACRGIASVAA